MNDKELKIQLGLKIKHYRTKLGLTQEELGEKIGRTQRQVSLIEIGNSFPNPETLTNITTAFKCSMKDLFDFEPIQNIKMIKKQTHDLVDSLSEEKLKIIYMIVKNL